MRKFRFRVFVEAKNLLNIKNLNMGSGFNARTGEVLNYGDLSGSSDQYVMYPDLLFNRGISTYGWDRLVRLGIKINFN